VEIFEDRLGRRQVDWAVFLFLVGEGKFATSQACPRFSSTVRNAWFGRVD
jgi:hypothetical protein